ncbi:hypothetical protein B0T24DRAFT_597128 [Lasiosphaeria ovina]|uniref:Uncharacterized protein n=1 Tax=Lasiosphaeria ovina TaxID=92902 RepID=A0AAE0K0V8_9PEZI|nr:hypothetical protein B0T24DRAFT_597128 [Lasiosphaeria ovina]
MDWPHVYPRKGGFKYQGIITALYNILSIPGQDLPEVKNPSIRQTITIELLSLDVIIQSFKTFHKNMVYFTIGVDILTQHILDEEPDKTQKGNKSPFQRLLKDWAPPARPLIEAR